MQWYYDSIFPIGTCLTIKHPLGSGFIESCKVIAIIYFLIYFSFCMLYLFIIITAIVGHLRYCAQLASFKQIFWRWIPLPIYIYTSPTFFSTKLRLVLTNKILLLFLNTIEILDCLTPQQRLLVNIAPPRHHLATE